jgi:Cu(I)/Ag(I) efflux system protein CusF
MKKQIISVLSVTVLTAGAAVAADMSGMKMDPPAASAAAKPQVNHAVGVVKSLDAANGKVTLSHEPVPSIKWPAMTMAFRISKEMAATVKAGDKVNFDFTANGMDATVTKITVAK